MKAVRQAQRARSRVDRQSEEYQLPRYAPSGPAPINPTIFHQLAFNNSTVG